MPFKGFVKIVNDYKELFYNLNNVFKLFNSVYVGIMDISRLF